MGKVASLSIIVCKLVHILSNGTKWAKAESESLVVRQLQPCARNLFGLIISRDAKTCYMISYLEGCLDIHAIRPSINY